MKFKSLDDMLVYAKATFQRFPWVILASIFAVCLAFMVIGEPQPENHLGLIRVWFLCVFEIPLMLAIALFCESTEASKAKTFLYYAAALLLAVAFYQTYSESQRNVYWYRFGQLDIAAHLAVAFALFVPRGSIEGFWRFNEILFVRFLVTALYSLAIFSGLALALKGIDFLFDVKVPLESYQWLAATIGIGFNTWFYLSGVPRAVEVQERHTWIYPQAVKIFTQYVLVPLVSIYFAILYAYLFKILGAATWPHGTVGYLVGGLSSLGMLAILFVYPIRDREDSRWIRAFSKWFYMALLPLLLLLFAAIWKRVSTYGITEPRYFLLVLGLWVFAIAIYYIVRGHRDIRVIPVSLCLLAIFTTFGPWSAFSVSRASQLHRLEELLLANELMQDHKIKPHQGLKEIAAEDYKDIVNTIKFLNKNYGDYLAEQLFPDLVLAEGSPRPLFKSYEISEQMIRKLALTARESSSKYYRSFTSPLPEAKYVVVTGFDVYQKIQLGAREDTKDDLKVPLQVHKELRIRSDLNTRHITIELMGTNDKLDLSMGDVLDRLAEKDASQITADDYVLVGSDGALTAQLRIYFLSFFTQEKKNTLAQVNGDLLIKVNR